MTTTATTARRRQYAAPSDLVVPLDGSDRSARALPVATALAQALHGTVSVVEELVGSTDLVGDLLQAAHRPGAGLCLSTHGRSGLAEVLLGSVTQDLVLRSPEPVVVVGPACRERSSFERVQVCFDGSDAAFPTLDVAAAWAKALGATAWVTHAVEAVEPIESAPGDVSLDAVVYRGAEQLRAAGAEAEWDVLHGRHPADDLASWAGLHDIGLLVVGTHPRSRITRALGSTTSRLLHLAPCPVVVVGPGAAGG